MIIPPNVESKNEETTKFSYNHKAFDTAVFEEYNEWDKSLWSSMQAVSTIPQNVKTDEERLKEFKEMLLDKTLVSGRMIECWMEKGNKKIENPVGMVVALVYNRNNRLEGMIPNLFVKSKYRSLGIGASLLENAEQYLRNEGAEKVKLSVIGGNVRALEFYHRSGYKTSWFKLEKQLPPPYRIVVRSLDENADVFIKRLRLSNIPFYAEREQYNGKWQDVFYIRREYQEKVADIISEIT